MSKFTDSIKGFTNKHFTREVTCCNCGKTGKVMFFSTLSDGQYLCSDCKHEIPAEFQLKTKETSFAEYRKVYDYVQYSKTQLAPIFNPTADYSYGNFEVDPIHCLCRVNGSFVFEISRISMYAFHFKAEEFKDGIFSSKAKGDVYLTGLLLSEPFASFESQIIKHNAKGKAEKPLFSNTVLYQDPEEMTAFVDRFDSLWERFQAEKAEKELEDLVEKKALELLVQKETMQQNVAV